MADEKSITRASASIGPESAPVRSQPASAAEAAARAKSANWREGDGVERDEGLSHNSFTGSAEDIILAGIVDRSQLPPQEGRIKGLAMFMPDGSPVPPGAVPASISCMPGVVAVRVRANGKCCVRVAIPLEEQQRRREARPPKTWRSGDLRCYEGTAAQLERVGVKSEWLQNVTAPGKVRGTRVISDGRARVTVSVGERMHFSVYVEQRCFLPNVEGRRGAAFARFLQRAIG